MAKHSVSISWVRGTQVFVDNRYSRVHSWRFDGGQEIHASPSPQVVPLPFSDPTGVDPEEAFIAALSSCHMLWFLSLAAGKGLLVNSYEDSALGTLGRNAQDRMAITDVLLRPLVVFDNSQSPSEEIVRELHHAAHEACFIANSVNCPVRCEPSIA